MSNLTSRMSWPEPPPKLLADYSLEITAAEMRSIAEVTAMVPRGTKISITSLPNEAFSARLAAAQAVSRSGFRAVPHLAARGFATQEALQQTVAAFAAEAACDQVFVIAGDVPSSAGPYADALAVIRSGVLAEHGIETVGVGGYPEGHPKIPDDVLWSALADKVAAVRAAGQHCEVMTQFAFSADPIIAWIRKVRDYGYDFPIRVGVPGTASVKTLLRFAAHCGVGASTSALRKYGMSLTRLLSPTSPKRLLDDLTEALMRDRFGDVRIHFYPFGGLAGTARWVHEVTGS